MLDVSNISFLSIFFFFLHDRFQYISLLAFDKVFQSLGFWQIFSLMNKYTCAISKLFGNSEIFSSHSKGTSKWPSLKLVPFSKICRCVENVRIRSYSGPYVSTFGLNTERYSLSLHIQSECEKMRTRIIPNTDIFYAVCKALFSDGDNTFCSAEFLVP